MYWLGMSPSSFYFVISAILDIEYINEPMKLIEIPKMIVESNSKSLNRRMDIAVVKIS
jgi:hypothetical protein